MKEKEETGALRMGRIIHATVLEPERFDTEYVTVPEEAPKKPSSTQLKAKKPSDDTIKAIAWWEGFRAQNMGREIITGKEIVTSKQIVDRMYGDKACGPLLRMKGKREVSAYVRDPGTGLMLKARFDLLPDSVNFLIDVKSCRSTAPREWAKDVAVYGYARQAAFYLKVANLLGLERTEFLFVTTEKEIPFNPTAWQIGQKSIAKGREEIDRLLYEYKQCVDNDEWPGYTTGGTTIFDAPQWYLDGKPFMEHVEYELSE